MQLRFIYLFIVLLCLKAPVAIADSHGADELEVLEENSFEYYDGGWQIGFGFELSELRDFDGGDFGWALIIGKDFYQNDDISLGGQMHFSRSFFDDVSEQDEASRDSTNFFATAHFRSFSVLKFKLGVSYTKLDTFFGNESDNGMIYGIDLALSNNQRVYAVLLSYEDSLSGADYRAVFLNLAFLFLH